MDRRDFMAAAAGSLATTATGLFTGRAAFASSGTVNPELVVTNPKALRQLQLVAKTASECVAAATACIQHCQEEMIQGHGKEFADCSLAAHQMASICENIGTLAGYKAAIIADFLEGCIKACETCRVACKEHEAHFGHGMHLECKRCMEACAACRDACRELRSVL